MSVKATMKGFVIAIDPVQTMGEKGTKVQSVYMRTPGYRDEFGEQKAEDEFWKFDVIGQKVDAFDLTNKIVPNVEYKVEVTVWLNGRKFYAKEDTFQLKPFYGIQGNINEIRLI